MTEEVWKPINDFDNYFISSLGRVKSTKYKKERFLKFSYVDRRKGKKLYAKVVLVKGNKLYTKTIHSIIAEIFLNYKYDKNSNKVIDHIDNNSLNNNVDNLQIISCRNNLNKDIEFPGAHFNKKSNNWESSIYFENKNVHLGIFKSKEDASNRYIEVFKDIENNNFNISYYRNKYKIKKYEN